MRSKPCSLVAACLSLGRNCCSAAERAHVIWNSAVRTSVVLSAVSVLAASFAFAANETAELKRPAPIRITLSPQAQMRLTETLVTRTFEIGFTNTPCDSVLSAAQCRDYILGLPLYEAPRYTQVSLDNVDLAFSQIDSVLKNVVSHREDAPLWSALRTLGVQARQTIAVLANQASLPTREFPPAILNLYRDAGIARIELRHRITITGNLMLVETTMLDRTTTNVAKTLTTATVKSVVDMTESLKGALASAMPALNDFAIKEIATRQKASATP